MSLLEALAASTRSPDAAEGRINYAVYGTVTRNADPKGLCRVKAKIAGQEDRTETDWLCPLLVGATEGYPAVGEKVAVLFIDGNLARGVYGWFPETTTKNRATEAMLLATTFCGLYNDLVAKFNTLKARFNTLQSATSTNNGILTPHVHTGGTLGGGLTGTSVALEALGAGSTDADADAAKAKAANGSVVGAIATDQVVLSGVAKVR